jgi:hypothetical protein
MRLFPPNLPQDAVYPSLSVDRKGRPLDGNSRYPFRQRQIPEGSIPKLGGWPLIAVMRQVGNLLPHVALSARLAQHLMPAWNLSAAEGGLMASGYSRC